MKKAQKIVQIGGEDQNDKWKSQRIKMYKLEDQNKGSN